MRQSPRHQQAQWWPSNIQFHVYFQNWHLNVWFENHPLLLFPAKLLSSVLLKLPRCIINYDGQPLDSILSYHIKEVNQCLDPGRLKSLASQTESPQHLHRHKCTSQRLRDVNTSLYRLCLILSTFYLKVNADMPLHFTVLGLISGCNKWMLNAQLPANEKLC